VEIYELTKRRLSEECLFMRGQNIMINQFRIRIIEKAIDGDTIRSLPYIAERILPVAIMDTNAKLNGTQVMTNLEFVRRFADQLRRIGVFSGVASEIPLQMPNNSIMMTLSIEETNDSHIGLAFLNMFLGLISYGILFLFLPWKTDFSSLLVVDAKLRNGTTRRYISKSSGTVSRDLFANHAKANTDLAWQVTNNNINSLMNQIIADADSNKGYFAPSPIQYSANTQVLTSTQINRQAFCPHCGTKKLEDAKFCRKCGHANLEIPAVLSNCLRCNTPVQSGCQFCSVCGIRIDEGGQ